MTRPVLVLLHGVGLDHTVWQDVIPQLQDRFSVRTPNLPGHSGAVRVASDIDLAGLAELVAASLDEGSHLVGFSLGALVAQYLAIHRPELVASLTSVSSVCRRTPEERAAVLSRLEVATADPAKAAAASIDRWFAGTTVAPATIEHTRAVLEANDPDQFLACYRVFCTGDAVVGPHLGRITVPSLAVTGGEDPGSTPDMTYRLAAAIPDAHAVIVPGARHMLPVEQPHTLAGLIEGVAHV
ncbi:alpha/beta fold hydrolase [Actinoplanes couchii]|uniref:3-oxoadipate enol-lactonase n=1 Tax=Actinoplanes couchii TaxID=403638 RepID=A0ABQ3XG18_9ACTN|nr:alpha/beta hydrolase [Actinoplanes couchii]MDR6320933.1 pimeloyl-ACP methyl ester carboxylesterase [Actinoplanes couchii]GID57445.1 3-oxoadipate enol-lactonase [Actinoplanes couchii]